MFLQKEQMKQVLVNALYFDDLLIAFSIRAMLVDTNMRLAIHFKIYNHQESYGIHGTYIFRGRKVKTLRFEQRHYVAERIEMLGLRDAREINMLKIVRPQHSICKTPVGCMT